MDNKSTFRSWEDLLGKFPGMPESIENKVTLSTADYSTLIPKAHVLDRLDEIEKQIKSQSAHILNVGDVVSTFAVITKLDQLKKELS